MANYSITAFKTGEGDIDFVSAALKTKLDTLDSTSNPVVLIEIVPSKKNHAEWIGILLYD